MDLTKIAKGRFRKAFVLVMTLGYAIAFLALIDHFFVPLVLAAVFTGVVYPMHTWLLAKFRGRENAAVMTTLVITVLAILIPVILLLGLVAEQAIEVTNDVKPWIEHELAKPKSTEHALPDWFPMRDRLEPYESQIRGKLSQMSGKAGTFVASSLGKMTQGTAAFLFQLFIMLYAMYFFLKSGPQILDTILGYFPLTPKDKSRMIQVCMSVSRATIKGTLVIGVIQGALGGLGFAVAGINAAVFWGALMMVLSVIPGLGATLIWLPGVIYLLMSGHTVAGLGLLVWSAAVVSSVDNVLRPILVGRDTEMPGILILLSTLGGLTLFGASGLILGPMLAALFLTVTTIYLEVFKDWLDQEDTPVAPKADS